MTVAVDIRAKTFCSLGTLISGNFADTYAQGNGLITTRGSVELRGIYALPVGTRVEFSYAKDGYIARLPRTLRVLSSFTDPFRKKTTVQLGCLLTFLDNRRPPVEDPNSRDENDVPCYVYEKAILPISAKYVVEQILSALGITGEPVPLTNTFSVEKFDLSPGFIKVLGDLLISESYIGYLDEAEVLRFRSLATDIDTGPVLDSRNIIDISRIGFGDLPGDAIVVNYSSRRLKPPEELDEDRAKRSWEWEEGFGPTQKILLAYQDDEGAEAVIQGSYRTYDFSATYYDVWDRAVERYEYNTTSASEINSRWVIDKFKIDATNLASAPTSRYRTTTWKYKIPAPKQATPIKMPYIQSRRGITGIKSYLRVQAEDKVEDAADCVYEKPEGYEEVVEEFSESFISELEVAGTLNLDTFANTDDFGTDVVELSTAAFPPGAFGVYSAPESRTIITYEKDESSGITKTTTKQYMMYGKTTSGQQDMATKVQTPPEINTNTDFTNWVKSLIASAWALRYVGVEIRIRTEREYGLQRRPSQEERSNTYNQKPEVTEQKAEVTWATGGTESTNYIEFTMPYAPDDKISWTELGGYTSTPSDAGAKALRFGRLQNRLLLGNRNGISIQIPAELLPRRPFDPLYVEAVGLTAQYRVNGATFSFDSNGIVASADCLFWGGVA